VPSSPTTEPRHLEVATPQGASGVLIRDDERYLFTCSPGASREAEISLTMPQRAMPYAQPALHPIFQMNLPEGYVLERLRQRFAKAARLTPMLMLALTGQAAAIGRVRLAAPSSGDAQEQRGERLAEILAWDGAEDLFEALAQRYLLRTGASGVQPKLLVPEDTGGKAALAAAELIVKSAGAEFPGLAVNEYLCMTIAREAGLPVPEFWLSHNRELFVMRRFDRSACADAFGFEDMAVLMGLGAEEKYRGSYEGIARAIDVFGAPQHRNADLAQLFDHVALTCLIGNGDAHLKNFGLLYTHPHADDARLAPVYDLVNTTAYLRDDSLALALGGSRSFFGARLGLRDFATRCGVADAEARVHALLDAAHRVLARERDLAEHVPTVHQALLASLARFEH
jgi:serine/threonine-protein kinase HipA